MKNFLVLSLVFIFSIANSCKTVPVTGRGQIKLIPSSQIHALSFSNYNQVLKESKLSDNSEWTNTVKRVGANIQGAVQEYMRGIGEYDDVQGFKWEFHLLEDESVNAWAMPGGKVAFYEGIMPICQNDAGVAVVMGHEIAHAVANHGNERLSLGLTQQLGGTVLSEALKTQPMETQRLAMAAFGLGSSVGVMLPYSREHESEADRIGLIFMAKAGYDPREAVDFWLRMQAQDKGPRPPGFLSTHPHPDNRIRKLKKYMPEALEIYQRNQGK